MAEIQNPWAIKFTNTQGFTVEEIELAEKLISGGFTMENKSKGVSATYGELDSGSFKWGQTWVSYEKSMVSIPYFVEENGEIYILVSNNYQPISMSYFDESARGFATTKDNELETTMETAVRVIEQKTNLPAGNTKIFRLAAPINPDPSWFDISNGLSYVGCEFPLGFFKKLNNGEYVVKEEFVIDPSRPVPNVTLLDEYLKGFDPNIESTESPICGLTLGAAALLWRYLSTKAF